MLVPLAIINHFKPTRPVHVNLDELYPEGIHERDLALPPDPQFFTFRNFFLWLDGLHKFVENNKLRPFRKRALKKAEILFYQKRKPIIGLISLRRLVIVSRTHWQFSWAR